MQLIPRSGLSAGRNALVQACTTRYIVLLDDDVFFTASTALDVLLDELERNQTLHIAAGAYMQYSSTDAAPYIHDYSLLFDKSKAEDGSWYAYTPQSPPPGQCYAVHGAHNFFMARTATLRRYPWHPKMGESASCQYKHVHSATYMFTACFASPNMRPTAIFEHEHFFFQLFLAGKGVLSCPHISVFHYRAPNLHDERYMSNSLRFKEAVFARYFCHSFPQVCAGM